MSKWLAGKWDSIPVKGRVMTGAVAIVGAVLAIVLGAQPGTSCHDAGGLPDVYKPSRLQVVAPLCRTIRFRVVAWRHEHDDDYHVNGVVLSESAHAGDGSGWVNAANVSAQHGLTVVEFVPRFPHPAFRVGMVLDLTGTKVRDLDHRRTIGGKVISWIEMHPVTAYSVVNSGGPMPDPARLAPATEEKR